jgi:hypothetical protein
MSTSSQYFMPGTGGEDSAGELIQCELKQSLKLAQNSNYNKVNYKCNQSKFDVYLNNSSNDRTQTQGQRLYSLANIQGLGGKTQYGNGLNNPNQLFGFSGTAQGQPGGMKVAPKNRF